MEWQNLSSKLKALGVTLGKDLQPKPPLVPRFPIESVVDGDFEETLFGPVFCVTQYFPLDHVHGAVPLRPSNEISTLARWARIPQVTIAALDNIVFLDTETTGLSGGTGTLAFMIGVGRFDSGGFTLAQYFMRHPVEEGAMLAALTRFLTPVDAIVTYNGKAFDIPLLRTRYTMQAFEFPMEGTPHFDLLALSRRLWKDRLPACNLSIIENQVLGVMREEEEVPGYAIPELYLDFLRSGDARPMHGIFYHNSIDILSLAALFAHTAQMLETPLIQQPEDAVDLASIARLFQFLGDADTAMTLFEQSLGANLPDEVYWKTLERAASLLKRQGNYTGAVTLWEKAAEQGQLYACEELAKYYEHRACDIPLALHWAEHALAVLAATQLEPLQRNWWHQHYYRRIERLQRKKGS
jgi:uncharacterized protein YprB with RNaseH-like and TPR domain